jgi:hypothetical protein
MRTAAHFQNLVTLLATKHDVDLTQPDAYLHLRLARHGHLVIERRGVHRIGVTNYVPVAHDLTPDPAVVFFTGYRPTEAGGGLWAPMEVNQVFGGWALYAELDDRGWVVLHDPVAQAELAAECEQVFARNLARHGWLRWGQRSQAAIQLASQLVGKTAEMQPEMHEGQWPQPTAGEPSPETLEEWIDGDGACAATDGCWVELDGVCPHGHPSWLLRLGLI